MTTWKRSRVMWRSFDDMKEIESGVEVVRRHGRDRECCGGWVTTWKSSRVMWWSGDDMEEIESDVEVM